MRDNWIIGLGTDEHQYKIGDVTYIVTSRFVKPDDSEKKTINDRMKNYVGSDFADLTEEFDEDTMDSEYVCSAAGKRTNAVEKE